jgi:hypothetical protein
MPGKISNQKQKTTSSVTMDAGAFLRMINSGAQSQVHFFEQRIRKMGDEVGARYKLVSLSDNKLCFEDIDTGKYYSANIRKSKGNNITLKNIAEIQIVETKKGKSFRKSVCDLVDAIYEDDHKRAESVMEQITKQRFRSRVVPESGYVTTRDGITRQVAVKESIVPAENKRAIIEAVAKALSDNVKVSRGRIVEAKFNNTKFEIPITEMTRRKVVSRQIKNVAQSAYMVEGFQNRVYDIAGLVSKKDDKALKEAVKNAAEFLAEEQEFSLLTLAEMRELISLALATKGVMNEELGKDVGLLFYRTNCKVNHDVILKEWKETARMTENAQLVENVRKLESYDTKQFESGYGLFLKSLFVEDMSKKAAKGKIYLNALKSARNVLEGSAEELTESLDEYITRLEHAGDEIDDATLSEVEELVSSISEQTLDGIETLNDFDEIPEPYEPDANQFGDADLGDEAGDEEVGGLGGGGMGGLDLGDEGLGDELGDEDDLGDEDLGDEDLGGEDLGGEEGLGDELGDEEEDLFDDTNKKSKPISEGKDGECQECGTQGVINDEGMCTECSAIPEFKKKVSKLNESHLKMELKEWRKNGLKFFAEDGQETAEAQLKIYAEHAQKINAPKIAEAFENVLKKCLAESKISIPEEKQYDYKPSDVKVDADYISEDHNTWKNKMKQTKVGGQEGGKETASGDAMGCADDDDCPNTMKDAPHGIICCEECSGQFEIVECMSVDGAVCPDCGADVHNQLMEAIEGAGHQMDRIGGDTGGVAATGLGVSDGRKAGGAKQEMDKVGGKGVASELQTSDGRSAVGGKGKKEGMDQDGSGVAEEGGEVEEDQYKDATRRRKMAQPVSGKATLNATESKIKDDKTLDESQTVVLVTDEPVDKVTQAIAATMSDDMEGMEDMEGLDEMPPVDDAEVSDMEGDVADMADGMEDLEGDMEGMTGDVEGEDEDEGEDEGEDVEGEGEGEGEDFEFGDDEEDEDEDEELEEGKVPEAFKKNWGKKDKKDDGDEDEDEELEEGKVPEAFKKNWGKKGKKEEDEEEGEAGEEDEDNPVNEDMVAPTEADYDGTNKARKDGDGKEMTSKPKFTETDVAGGKYKKASNKK